MARTLVSAWIGRLIAKGWLRWGFQMRFALSILGADPLDLPQYDLSVYQEESYMVSEVGPQLLADLRWQGDAALVVNPPGLVREFLLLHARARNIPNKPLFVDAPK